MRERRVSYRVLVGKPEVRRPLRRPRCRREDNIKWMFEKWDVGYELDRSSSGQGQVSGSCECDNEHFYSIKCRKFSDQLRTCRVLRKASAPWVSKLWAM
jgi:hypothetical protein